jgi:ubiquinone/menaquinone biosynthesis C-methylase UbiE
MNPNEETMQDEQTRRAMAPTHAEIAALPLSTNGKIAAELLGGRRGKALDVGCGDGKFTRALAGLSTETSGIDVKAKKIDEARAAAKEAGAPVDFRVASGEALPWADATFDVVAFSNSLHHMPTPSAALNEAARALKPGGLLYVMEPVPSGNYHDATVLVNDETAVRTEAYHALRALAAKGLEPVSEIMYRARREFSSFEEWREDQIDRDVERKKRFDAQPDVVRARFEGAADKTGGKLGFDQVFRVNLLRKAG